MAWGEGGVQVSVRKACSECNTKPNYVGQPTESADKNFFKPQYCSSVMIKYSSIYNYYSVYCELASDCPI